MALLLSDLSGVLPGLLPLFLRWREPRQLVKGTELPVGEHAMLAARQIARQLEVGELHLDHAAHLQAATLEQCAHGGAPVRPMRFHAKPAIRPLAARGFDGFEFDRVVVVLHDARH